MTKTDPLRDIELLVRSHYGLIVINTPEQDRAETILRLVADRLSTPWGRHGTVC